MEKLQRNDRVPGVTNESGYCGVDVLALPVTPFGILVPARNADIATVLPRRAGGDLTPISKRSSEDEMPSAA